MASAGEDDGGHAASVVGRVGRVLIGTTDPQRPGEVLIEVRGGTEAFIAYCPEPLVRHSMVLVIEDLGNRQVAVTPWL